MPRLNSKTQPTKTLIEGINNNRVVRLRYQKESKEFKKPKPGGHIEKGDTVVRTVEPYEIKTQGTKQFLWAFDDSANTIKRFNLEGIKSARLLPQIFEPREI